MTAPTRPLRRVLFPALLSLTLLGGIAATGLIPGLALGRADVQPRAVTPRGPLEADELGNIRVFKTISPSVVHITTTAVQRDFFARPVGEVPRGTGSGFVWDEAGHIVTNFHVIQGAEGVKVTLADQTELPARFVGAFPDRDLAVLKVDLPANKHPPIPIGSSRELVVGQKVYAIGNPFGLDFTLTTGIVSALNREIESVTRRAIRGAIQTDAAINPGNSGGPLLDSAGRLIGVNTAIYSPSGASAGIGFAIPVDEVNRIVPRLIRDGRFVRPVLGITPLDERWTQALQRRMGLPKGVALVAVAPGGPAARAGLRPFTQNRQGAIEPGDVITAVNDAAVDDFDDLLTELEKRQAGDTVRLSVWREGRSRSLSVVVRAGD